MPLLRRHGPFSVRPKTIFGLALLLAVAGFVSGCATLAQSPRAKVESIASAASPGAEPVPDNAQDCSSCSVERQSRPESEVSDGTAATVVIQDYEYPVSPPSRLAEISVGSSAAPVTIFAYIDIACPN